MYTKLIGFSALAASSLLFGCDQRPAATVMPQPAEHSRAIPPTGNEMPSVDPSLPSTGAALNGPKTGTDATSDSALTRTERDTQMPMAGQANDHSNDAFAKRGDTTGPAKPAN